MLKTSLMLTLFSVTVQLQHLQCHQALVHYKSVCLNELKRKRTLSGVYSQNEVPTVTSFFVKMPTHIFFPVPLAKTKLPLCS